MVEYISTNNNYVWPPIGSPQRDERWKDFDSSVNAVSFGFVATAILISMFLVMAIFERFFRPNSPSRRRSSDDIESQVGFSGKLGHPSPKMSVYANGVSVLMPGDEVPTFIAQPAPIPCPREHISRPPHHQNAFLCPTPSLEPDASTQQS